MEASTAIGSWKKAAKGGSRTSYLVACWPPSRKKSGIRTPPTSQSMEGNTESSASVEQTHELSTSSDTST